MPKRNKIYWQKRFNQIEQAANNQSVEHIHALEEKYRTAIQEIDGKIHAWYQRIAINNNISMTDARRLLTASELKEFKWNVQQYIKAGKENAIDQRWMKELENASARFHINRLEALKLDIRHQIELATGGLVDGVDTLIRNVYADTFYHSCFEIQKGVGIGFDVAKLDNKKVSKILSKPWAVDGVNFSERLWGNKTKLINTVDKELSRMVLTGEPPQKAVTNIRKAMGTSQMAAARLVMTEQAYFTSLAQNDAYGELDVEEYEFVSTLDTITCDKCGKLDGKHFPVEEMAVGINAPPMHPFCRCTTCPYFDDEFTIGKRASRDANGKTVYEVPEKMTYTEWKKFFVDSGNKEGLVPITIPDIQFATKQGINITPKQQFNDTMVVSSAYNNLPIKVKQNLGDVIFEFGYEGSACDIRNKIIRVAMGASKEEIFHEMGHLIENYMMNSDDVRKYKEYLVKGMTYSDIIVKTYYDTVGNSVNVFLLNGNKFESEYQSRLYISNIAEALNFDGTINVDVMGEAISESFRKYMNGESISDEARKLIEGVIV